MSAPCDIVKKKEEILWIKCAMCAQNAAALNMKTDQFQATGGNFAKIFDVQNKKFVTVSCSHCGYTELYKAQSSTGWNVLDFLVGN